MPRKSKRELLRAAHLQKAREVKKRRLEHQRELKILEDGPVYDESSSDSASDSSGESSDGCDCEDGYPPCGFCQANGACSHVDYNDPENCQFCEKKLWEEDTYMRESLARLGKIRREVWPRIVEKSGRASADEFLKSLVWRNH
jgi:hypothetical protein